MSANRITRALLVATFISTSVLALTLHFARKMIEGAWQDNELELALYDGCTCSRMTGSVRLQVTVPEA